MIARRAAWLPEAGCTLDPKRNEALERFALIRIGSLGEMRERGS